MSKTCKGLHAIATKQLYMRPVVTTAEGLTRFANTVDLNADLASLVVDLRGAEVGYHTAIYVARNVYRVCRNLKWLPLDRWVFFDDLPNVAKLQRLEDLRLVLTDGIALPTPSTWLHLTHLDVTSGEGLYSDTFYLVLETLARSCPGVVHATVRHCHRAITALFDALTIWDHLRSLTLRTCILCFAGEDPPELRALERLDIDNAHVTGVGQFFSRCSLKELHFRVAFIKNFITHDPFAEMVQMNTTRLTWLCIESSAVPLSVPSILQQCPSLRTLNLGPYVELDTTPVGNVVPHGLNELCISLGDAAFESEFFAQLSDLLPDLESCTLESYSNVPVVDPRPLFSTTKRLTLLNISLNPSRLFFSGLPSSLQSLTVDVASTTSCWSFADAGLLRVRCPRLKSLAISGSGIPGHVVLQLVVALTSLRELKVFEYVFYGQWPTQSLTLFPRPDRKHHCPSSICG